MPTAILQHLYDLSLLNLRLVWARRTVSALPNCARALPVEDFTRGHVYPEGCGLRNLGVLECRRCNNELGSALDSHLTQFVKALMMMMAASCPPTPTARCSAVSGRSTSTRHGSHRVRRRVDWTSKCT